MRRPESYGYFPMQKVENARACNDHAALWIRGPFRVPLESQMHFVPTLNFGLLLGGVADRHNFRSDFGELL